MANYPFMEFAEACLNTVLPDNKMEAQNGVGEPRRGHQLLCVAILLRFSPDTCLRKLPQLTEKVGETLFDAWGQAGLSCRTNF
jgi:hypothetical protein